MKKFENIILIPPDINFNTYKFLKSGIDLGIIYDGFLGLEMPYLGIPTIICNYGGLTTVEGGNITIKHKNDYFNKLDNIGNVIEEFHKNYNNY